MGMVPVLDRRGRRYVRRDALSRRDPDIDYHQVYRQLATLEFPWDIYQALSFTLFRTDTVPSIGELLRSRQARRSLDRISTCPRGSRKRNGRHA